MKKVFPIVFAFVFLLSCNKDDEITREVGNQPPVIELNSETGIYITKIGEEVSTEKDIVFTRQEMGDYKCRLYAENEDGSDTKEFVISVVDQLPIEVTFVAPSFYTEQLVKYVELGKTLYLRPYVNAGAESYSCSWSLNNEPIDGANSLLYAFTPEAEGDYTLTVTVSCEDAVPAAQRLTRNIAVTGSDKVSVDIPVKCLPAGTGKKRP